MNSYTKLIAQKLNLSDEFAFEIYMHMCGSGIDFSSATCAGIIKEAKLTCNDILNSRVRGE